jgi:glycosidase
MARSVFDDEVQAVLDQAQTPSGALFPSPADWRDQPIYFLMVDRFNNPNAAPRNMPFDAEFSQFQGGTFNGIREKLRYLQDLGIGALWLSPVLKNCRFDLHAYHGYGIQNFLAVEPRFASGPEFAERELRNLVDEAHRLGIYVIFDIVLHHAGDVFEYVIGGQGQADAPWRDQPKIAVRWRDENGVGNPPWTQAPTNPPLDAAVFPDELRSDSLFTQLGNAMSNGFHPNGDFNSLKGIDSDVVEDGLQPAHIALIRAYQYIVAKFDVDGFRIDTLKFISPNFERIFGNAMREFALGAGKKNFFTFGEVYDNENEIALFIGRNTSATGDVVGVDAALDYPLFFALPGVLKGLGASPADIANVFENRKSVEADILTSHGEAGAFFVTFLDNHDQGQRFGFTGPTQLPDQITLGMAVLSSLQGIPCFYYGTEQGLSGHKDGQHQDDSMVREALWGKANGFDVSHPLYQGLQKILQVRSRLPALRYGRLYFRQISGNGFDFGLSPFPAGVISFSRILNQQEVVVVANTNIQQGFAGEVIIDQQLNPANSSFRVEFSNKNGGSGGNPVFDKPKGSVRITEINGAVTDGPARSLRIQLQPMEVQILRRQ